jgi:outer membrane PBP1 activator LpoA protein
MPRTHRLPLLLMLLSLLLSACQTTTIVKTPGADLSTPEQRLLAEDYERDGEWDRAYALYRQLAEQAPATARARWLNKAALMLYHGQRYDEIDPLYAAFEDIEWNPDEQQARQVMLAGAMIHRGKTYRALSGLPDIDRIGNPEYQALALAIRADGMLAIGKPLQAAELRIRRGSLLEDPRQLLDNQQAIWDALNRMGEPAIIKALARPLTPALRGWLELNLIARRSDMLPQKIEPWVAKWRQLYPDHEADGAFVEALLENSRLIFIRPTHIALMLPLSGKLKSVAEAIQDGFLYAWYADPGNRDDPEAAPRPVIDLIDASSDPLDFYLQYSQAIENGADFIVGPLAKPLVNDLLAEGDRDVPTLTLNYADDAGRGAENLYQFGLSPEDEAEQVADYALVDGRYHALTLTPDTRLGARLRKAFSRRFEALGGRVVGGADYAARKSDYSVPIKQMLNLTSSYRRHDILQTVLGRKLEFIPRRRQDVDMIFIVGNPRQARLIKPQLKFHRAKDLPVYATSSVSSGTPDPDADRDLNGLLFVDTPWSLQNDSNPDYQQVIRRWPKSVKRYGRFFALGIDAYRLIPSLRRLLINPGEKLPLNTGIISVDRNGRIHRELLLATFDKGLAKVIRQAVGEPGIEGDETAAR